MHLIGVLKKRSEGWIKYSCLSLHAASSFIGCLLAWLACHSWWAQWVPCNICKGHWWSSRHMPGDSTQLAMIVIQRKKSERKIKEHASDMKGRKRRSHFSAAPQEKLGNILYFITNKTPFNAVFWLLQINNQESVLLLVIMSGDKKTKQKNRPKHLL